GRAVVAQVVDRRLSAGAAHAGPPEGRAGRDLAAGHDRLVDDVHELVAGGLVTRRARTAVGTEERVARLARRRVATVTLASTGRVDVGGTHRGEAGEHTWRRERGAAVRGRDEV